MRIAMFALVSVVGCGRIGFDPAVEGTWTYSSPRAIYVYNDVAPIKTITIAENTPIFFEGDARYSVAPDLTAATGLTLDPVTGVVAGRPTRTSPPTNYIITATTGDESRTAVVSIRTAPGFYVNDLGDKGDLVATDDDCLSAGGRCTLRAALGQLAAFDATPRVALIPAGTILLGGSELAVVQPAELIGAGRDATIIDAADASRALGFGTDNTVIISDLTLQRGTSPDGGGCAYGLGGTFTLRDVAVRNCTSAGNGAGVLLWDDFETRKVVATIERVTFEQNQGTGSSSAGGALLMSTGAPDSSATVTASTFSMNTATADGGALAHTRGPLSITQSLFEGNSGGGALGFQDNTDVTIVNTTIIGNRSSVSGFPGGVHSNNNSVVRMINNTIAGNSCAGGCFNGAGVYTNTGGMLTVRNTIIAGNRDLENSTLSNCAGGGTRISLGHNLMDSPNNGICFDAVAGDQFDTDPQIESLAQHGGPTGTAAIDAASPAYNAASTTECPATDQRGLGFRRPAAGACDIGAFEAQ